MSRLCCFRPLAGMSCNPRKPTSSTMTTSFRPLAGISCNNTIQEACSTFWVFPSPCGDKLHNTKLLYLFLPQKKRTFSGKKGRIPGCEAESPAGGKSARSAQNPPGGAESAPAGRVFLVLLWAVYRMRTRMTAGMAASFSASLPSTMNISFGRSTMASAMISP